MSAVVAEALLRRARGLRRRRAASHPAPPPLACVRCGEPPHRPAIVACGHTHCAACLPAGAACAACGRRTPHPPAADVLVRALATRWWPREARAADAAESAAALLRRHHRDPAAALDACDDALCNYPDSHRLLAVRCLAYAKLERWQQALDDASTVVKLRPKWHEGYFLRGLVLLNTGRHQEAIICIGISVALGKSIQASRKLVQQALSKLFQHGLRRPRKILRYICVPRILGNLGAESLGLLDEKSSKHPMETVAITKLLDTIKKEFIRIADASIPSTFSNHHLPVEQTDFDCVLCCRTLWQPVTTPCGHTYCWQCLQRCMDYNYACPLCITPLGPFFSDRDHGVNEWVETAIMMLLPSEYEARRLNHSRHFLPEEKEPSLSVFICTAAFPSVSCPLFVFEPRYRLMVRRCLESGDRRFGIVACADKRAPEKYAEYGTILEIRDCILMPDGCSILSTVGISRFRVLARGEQDGYDIATVEVVRDKPPESSSHLIALHTSVRLKARVWFEELDQVCRDEIEQSFGMMPSEEIGWQNSKDGPAWAWWILAILPLATQLKVMILATEELEKRLRAIDRTLDFIYFLGRKEVQTEVDNIVEGDGQLSFSVQSPQHFCPEPWLLGGTTSTSQLGEQTMSCSEEDGLNTDMAQDSASRN